MLFLAEVNDSVDSVLEEGKDGKKSLFIEGIFAQAEIGNRNGRIYPRAIMEKAVEGQQKLVQEKRAMGELNHPSSPTLDLGRVSHLITELKWDGDNVRGKAKILESVPMGQIAAGLINDGVRFGVSTRGVGSVKKNAKGLLEVQGDFRMICVDLVSDPSAPDAFVEGLYEGVEWIMGPDGTWEQRLAPIREEVKKSTGLTLQEKLDIFNKSLKYL